MKFAKPYNDLREFVTALDEAGKLYRVHREINKDTELQPLVRWQFRGLPEAQRRAFLFEQVHDSRGRTFDMPVVVGALAGSEDIYAASVGCVCTGVSSAIGATDGVSIVVTAAPTVAISWSGS